MTAVTYSIVPIPLWYFADTTGIPLGGGYMATWVSQDKITPKAIYTDATGDFAWPNPVYFNENGQSPGAFFWANDTPYYIEIFDANGNLIDTLDNYGPGIAGGGGGGSTTDNVSLDNYINNNVFWRNQGILNNIQSNTVIAPSNHEGLVPEATSFPAIIPNVGPDILYLRSNNTSTDNLVFATSDFSAGSVPLTGDVTPEFYIDLTCTNAGSETLKAIQFPVDLHVKNLEQQTMTAIIWAKGFSAPKSITMNFIQYFGTGSATTPVVTAVPINAGSLTSTWTSYVGTFIVPSVGSKVLGTAGDDACYLQVNFPTATTFRTFITKPKLYLGTIGSVFPELQTYDKINTIISSPRTGDFRIGINNFAPFGWVIMNDGTIGNASSNATTRANIDTWPLFSFIWNNIPASYAQMFTSSGSPVSRGATDIADFNANNALSLTKTLGRALASIGIPSSGGTGTKWAVGQITGVEQELIQPDNLPLNIPSSPNSFFDSAGDLLSVTTSLLPASQAINVIQPTTYLNVYMKL